MPLAYNGQSMKTLLENLWELGFQGFNVTVPFKEEVANCLGLEGKSVNTVYRGKVVGRLNRLMEKVSVTL